MASGFCKVLRLQQPYTVLRSGISCGIKRIIIGYVCRDKKANAIF